MSSAKKYFVWTWLFALFTATAGLSVQQIYCYCLDKTTVSLFAGPGNACKDESQPAAADCCKKARKSCCSKPGHKSHPGKPCTRQTTRVFQLKTEFIVEKQAEMPGFAPLCDAVSGPGAPEISLIQNVPPGDPLAVPPDTGPPPRSGKAMCLLYHNIRC